WGAGTPAVSGEGMMRRFLGVAALLALTCWAGSAAAATERLTASVHDYTLERDVTLEAEVVIPSTESWPVAFILHGCDGVNQWSKPALERRARFYAERGYATIILDSWKPRGLQVGRASCREGVSREGGGGAV